jgi:hypothetical protein
VVVALQVVAAAPQVAAVALLNRSGGDLHRSPVI